MDLYLKNSVEIWLDVEDWTCQPLLQAGLAVIFTVGLAFTLIWCMTWLRFYRELLRLRRSASTCISEMKRKEAGQQQQASKKELPRVSVLLPVKGVHSRSQHNWRHQMESTHGGDVEFIFCIESHDDPAYQALKSFREERNSDVNRRGQGQIKIVVAGLSFHSSQKIHNLLEGVKHVNPQSDYVLFLDDDAEMRPVIMRDLIFHLEEDPSVLVATGYPHEYISPTTTSISFAGFMLLGYRKLAYLNISLLHPPALWGGCLMLRRRELMDPNIGILEAWKERGYSDDMIMGGRVHRCGRRMCHPATCVLVSEVDPQYSVSRHFNYIGRQMFVLDTYSDSTDKTQNYILLVLVCILVLSTALVFHLITIAYSFRIAFRLWAGEWGLSSESYCGFFQLQPMALEILFVANCAFSFFVSMQVDAVITRMCQHVSDQPEKFVHHQNMLYLVCGSIVGYMANLGVQASCAFGTLFTDSIVWSGVRYYRKHGKVEAVWRTDTQGKPYTVPASVSMQKSMATKTIVE
uniref:ceramide glucosyltransferase n=1 Tax=Hemiselmis andersenii TaxID=464988 RepID=A0A6U2GAG5_HEMAN|mmetsp:Transcript_36316/g.85193  ORF Transcript_36316/g.85193 Transcript_36316/m.85193 type:complete len:519 (+) Transcript_36316:38-1594(+)